jgi:glycosyltransferase involved in cell wall biosynthesis
MNIWLVTIGEPVPLSSGRRDRLHRTGFLAQFLAKGGHRVLWWTSAFDHFRKTHIANKDETVEGGANLRIRLLRGRGYQRNVSLARLRDHAEIARKFAFEAERERLPDLIVSALPTIDLSAACTDFGMRHDVPVALDMRDMWPDIFVDTAPGPARPLARALLQPMFRQARRACAGASAITGITEAFVDWGVQRGGRQRSPLDRAFPLGYSAQPPAPDEIRASGAFWDRLGIREGAGFNVCYFGGLGRQLDLMHAIRAARALESQGAPVRFVLCGEGERLREYRAAAAGLSSVVLPGWVNQAHIYTLMRRCSAGLDPLPDRYDFLATVNNKAIEYLSAGLPVISSPRHGVLFELLEKRACGLSYDARDAQGLTALLTDLAGQPDRVAAMRRASTELFRERFMAETVCASMAEHFEKISQLRSNSHDVHTHRRRRA